MARTIPPGRTMTYGEIARRLGVPHESREVGQALGRNPIAIIVPCHRVLGADGKMGGFSATGGGALSMASGQRRRRRARVASEVASGSCSPAIPRGLQAMPQVPIGVSNKAKPCVVMRVRSL